LGFKGRSALYEDLDWQAYWPKLNEKLFEMVKRILSGDFRTTPDPCSAFCEFGTVCRYHEREKINR